MCVCLWHVSRARSGTWRRASWHREGEDNTQEYGTTAQEWRSSVSTLKGQGKGLLPDWGLHWAEDCWTNPHSRLKWATQVLRLPTPAQGMPPWPQQSQRNSLENGTVNDIRYKHTQHYVTNSAVSLDHEGHALDVLALYSLLEEWQCPASLLPTKAATGRTHPLGWSVAGVTEELNFKLYLLKKKKKNIKNYFRDWTSSSFIFPLLHISYCVSFSSFFKKKNNF